MLQAIIPDEMVAECLEDVHGSVWSGHPGVNKMLMKVKRYAIWPTQDRDVKNAVKNCKTCDQLREQDPRPVTPLHPIVARGVFDHVMADLQAPQQDNRRGCQSV